MIFRQLLRIPDSQLVPHGGFGDLVLGKRSDHLVLHQKPANTEQRKFQLKDVFAKLAELCTPSTCQAQEVANIREFGARRRQTGAGPV
jgi:hypothetical protein